MSAPGQQRAGVVATSRDARLNQSVQKATTLLRAAADDRAANVSSLARATGLPRATALRMIATLEQEGFLIRLAHDERILLGPELARLAMKADLGALLRDAAATFIADLSAAVNETVTLSVVAADGGLDLVEQVDAPHLLRPRSWIGQRFPLHATPSGKILLSTYDDDRLDQFLRAPLERFTPHTITSPRALREDLEAVRERGCALTVDEDEEGLSSISAGIVGRDGALIGVLSVSGPTQRLDDARRAHAAQALRSSAHQVEASLQRGPRR